MAGAPDSGFVAFFHIAPETVQASMSRSKP